MLFADFLRHGVEFSGALVRLGTDWLLQSTLLIVLGLLGGGLLRAKRAAAQSAVYRITLVAVLACPLVSLLLRAADIPGLHVELPMPAKSAHLLTAGTNPDHAGTIADDRPIPGLRGRLVPGSFMRPGEHASATASGVLPSDLGNAGVSGIRPEQRIASATLGVGVPQTDSAPIESAGAALPDWPSVVACLIAAGWFPGTCVLMICLLRDWRRAVQLRRSASPADPQTASDCLALAKQMGVCAPPVLRSPFATSASLVGLLRPAILLPEEERVDASNREILVHELAHLARCDLFWRLLGRMGTAVFFIQPLLWLLVRRMAISAEEVCDDYVLDFGFDRPTYARQLVEVAERYQPAPAVGIGVISLRSRVGRRVIRILDSSRQVSLRAGRRLVAVALSISVATTVSAGLLGIAWDQAGAAPADGQTQVAPPDLRAAASRPSDRFEFRGQVLDPDGKPLPGVKIYLVFYTNYTHGKLPLPKVRATTGPDGRFDFAMEKSEFDAWRLNHPWGIMDDVDYKNDCRIVAQADGYGPAWEPAFAFDPSGEVHKRILQTHPDDSEALSKKVQPVLRVVRDDVPLVGRVVDPKGRPVAGVKVAVIAIEPVKNEDLTGWLSAAEKENADVVATLSHFSRKQNEGGSFPDTYITSDVLPQIMPAATSGADGTFRLTGIGRERIVGLSIEGPGIESAFSVSARTRPGRTFVLPYSLPWSPEKNTYYGATFEHVARPSIPILGTVRDKDSGKPLAGVTIQAYKLAGNPAHDYVVSYFFHTTTDQEGRYRLTGMPIGKDNELLAVPPKDQPYLLSKKTADTAAPKDSLQVDFDLKRGIWIRGRVTDARTGVPIPHCVVEYGAFRENPSWKSAPGFEGAYQYFTYLGDQEGRYALPGLPGRGIVAVQVFRNGMTRYPLRAGLEKIPELRKAGSMFDKVVPVPLNVHRQHALAEVNPAEGAESVQSDFQLDPGQTLTGTVLDPAGKPLAGAHYNGPSEEGYWKPLSSDAFTINSYRPDKPRKVLFVHLERKLAGSLVVEGVQGAPLSVRLQPWGVVTGRVVDAEGKPMSDVDIHDLNSQLPRHLRVKAPDGEVRRVWESSLTDRDGRFRIEGLTAGITYRLSTWDRRAGKYLGSLFADVTAEAGQTKDVGELKIQKTKTK